MHRCRALDRWEEGLRVFDLWRTLFPVVLEHQLDGICSWGRDFDPVTEVRRIEP